MGPANTSRGWGIRWALEVCWEGPLEDTPLASEEGSEEGETLGGG